MGKLAERESYIMEMLEQEGRLSTTQVVEALGVSEATARRLFSQMEKGGKIVRNYGGIVPIKALSEYRFEVQEQQAVREKKLIGRLAASLVENGDIIYLDCGTTLYNMTLALAERIANGEIGSINIVTNSIPNVQALTPSVGCSIILVGGMYSGVRQDFSGALTETYLKPFHFTKCFLGTDGVSAEMGFSSIHVEISRLNRKVIEQSDRTYVLMDNSKFNKRSFISYADLGEVYGVVTDRPLEEESGRLLRRGGIKLFCPGQDCGASVV